MLVFYKKCKNNNEIQLTKNKMDLNNQKFKNHSHPTNIKQLLNEW